MSNEVYDLLDELAARGRLRGTMPGDYKPAESGDPMVDVLARVYALILSWPVAEAGDPDLDETKGAAH